MGKALWTKAFPKQVRTAQAKPKQPKPRKRIKAVSNRKRRALTEYEKEKQAWQLQLENQRCAITGEANPDVHHSRGRIGELLCLSALWVPLCRRVHNWTASHPRLAAQVGLLCPAGKYNTMPKPYEIKEHCYRLAFFRFLIGQAKHIPVRPQLDHATVIEIEKEVSAAVALGFWKRI